MILDAIIQSALVGFVGSLPVSIAFCQISLGVGLLAWLIRSVLFGGYGITWTPLDKGFILFVAACLLSTVFSIAPLASLVSMKKFYLIGAVYFVGFNVASRERVDELMRLFVLMSALTGLYGIVMYIFGYQTRLLGVQTMAMTSGGILMLSAFLGYPLFVNSLNKKGLLASIIAVFAASAILGSLVLNKTVSTWAGLLVGAGAYVTKKWIRLVSVIILASLLSLVLLANMKYSEKFFNYSKMDSWQARVRMWTIGWKLIKQRPILGTGLIDLGELYQKERASEDIQLHGNNRRVGHLHNNFIHITAITGFLGLAAFLYMWVIILTFIKNGLLSGNGERLQWVSYLAVVIGFLVNGMAEWNFGDSEVVTILWFVIGLALASWRLDRRAMTIEPS